MYDVRRHTSIVYGRVILQSFQGPVRPLFGEPIIDRMIDIMLDFCRLWDQSRVSNVRKSRIKDYDPNSLRTCCDICFFANKSWSSLEFELNAQSLDLFAKRITGFVFFSTVIALSVLMETVGHYCCLFANNLNFFVHNENNTEITAMIVVTCLIQSPI